MDGSSRLGGGDLVRDATLNTDLIDGTGTGPRTGVNDEVRDRRATSLLRNSTSASSSTILCSEEVMVSYDIL